MTTTSHGVYYCLKVRSRLEAQTFVAAPCYPEPAMEGLSGAMSPEDRAVLEGNTRKPFIHPHLPQAIIVPGTGPHKIDYSCTGAAHWLYGPLAAVGWPTGISTGPLGRLALLCNGLLLVQGCAAECRAPQSFGASP